MVCMLFLDYSPDIASIEYDIYLFVERNIEKIPEMTIRELANSCHVSVATISRFCKKFECDGFSDFKLKLKIYLSQKKQSIQGFDETYVSDFINKALGEEFQKKMLSASKLLVDSEVVLFLGQGSSNIIAEYAALYFQSLSFFSINMGNLLLNPSAQVNINYGPKVCIIALSVSGETTKIINNVKKFIRSGCKIISITNSSKCTLAKLSTVNIPYYIVHEKVNTADITSQIPSIYIVEKLAKDALKLRKQVHHSAKQSEI